MLSPWGGGGDGGGLESQKEWVMQMEGEEAVGGRQQEQAAVAYAGHDRPCRGPNHTALTDDARGHAGGFRASSGLIAWPSRPPPAAIPACAECASQEAAG